ncbi:MAG: hypothetical protein L6Q95_14880 [Planctomycetes bacterium]|nr:hypothetical protein [Planctomycetota bacterium]
MFTAAYHKAFSCDALVIDGESHAVPLVLDAEAPEADVVDAVLDRVVLMSRSIHDVRRSTFGLFLGRRDGRLLLAAASPAAVVSALEDAMAEFGPVRRGAPEPARGLVPLLAFVEGRVSFLRGPATLPFQRLAARRGLAIVAPAWSLEELE